MDQTNNTVTTRTDTDEEVGRQGGQRQQQQQESRRSRRSRGRSLTSSNRTGSTDDGNATGDVVNNAAVDDKVWERWWWHICGSDLIVEENVRSSYYWQLALDVALVAAMGTLSYHAFVSTDWWSIPASTSTSPSPSASTSLSLSPSSSPITSTEENSATTISTTTAATTTDTMPSSIYTPLIEFLILSLSVLNGWYLHTHHFASRFSTLQPELPSNSKFHWICLCIFGIAMIWGIAAANATATDDITTAIMGDFHQHHHITDGGGDVDDSFSVSSRQSFSAAMIVQRLAILGMLIHVGYNLPRATAFCVLLAFFLADSTLCYGLALMDHQYHQQGTALFLWGFAVALEFLVDFFIAVSLGEGLQVPFDLQHTLNHLSAAIFAPLGVIIAISISMMEVFFYPTDKEDNINDDDMDNNHFSGTEKIITNSTSNGTMNDSIFSNMSENADEMDSSFFFLVFNSILIVALLGLMYEKYQTMICTYYSNQQRQRQRRQQQQQFPQEIRHIQLTCLLVLVKCLVLSIWILGASLICIIFLQQPSSPTSSQSQNEEQEGIDNVGGDDDNNINIDEMHEGHRQQMTDNALISLHHLLGWSFLITLWLLLLLRSASGRPHDRMEGMWIISCWVTLLLILFLPQGTPTIAYLNFFVLTSFALYIQDCCETDTVLISFSRRRRRIRRRAGMGPPWRWRSEHRPLLINTTTTTTTSRYT